MADDYATKADLKSEVHALRTELYGVRDELRGEIRAVGVMVERMESKVDAYMELCSTKASKSEVDAADNALSERVSKVEDLVRHVVAERK
jgi:hypothetical protein